MKIKQLIILNLIMCNITTFASMVSIQEKTKGAKICEVKTNQFGGIGDEEKKIVEKAIKVQNDNIDHIIFDINKQNHTWELKLEEISYKKDIENANDTIEIKIHGNSIKKIRIRTFQFYGSTPFLIIGDIENQIEEEIGQYIYKNIVYSVQRRAPGQVVFLEQSDYVFKTKTKNFLGTNKKNVTKKTAENNSMFTLNNIAITMLLCVIVGYVGYNKLIKPKQVKKSSWQFWKN